MKIKFTYSLLFSLIMTMLFFSCTGDENNTGDEDTVVLRDTVILKVDSLVRDKRNLTKVNLNLVIQLAAFRLRSNADAFALTAHNKLNANIEIRKIGSVYVVTVGNFSEGSGAEDYLRYVKSKGFDNAFIKNLE